jgi:hypothetical protein
MSVAVCMTVKVSVMSFAVLEACFAGVKAYEPLKSVVSAVLATISGSNNIKTQA